MQAQQLQVQTCMRDVERLETTMDAVRSAGQRSDDDFDSAKKILVFERELTLHRKE